MLHIPQTKKNVIHRSNLFELLDEDVRNILLKLKVNNRIEAAAKAREKQIL